MELTHGDYNTTSPTLTAEELTNQVLEIRGTAAGTDLWVTFEIREHGELGAYDSVCALACVFGVKVTKTSGLPDAQLSSRSFFFFFPFCIYLFGCAVS